MIKRICEICGEEFLARNYQIKIGTGKYCSPKCRGKGVNKPMPIKDRIYNFIDKKEEDDCWEFQGFKNGDGYGIIGTQSGKNESAHRAIYKLEIGDIPNGMIILHECDNSYCCNPRHLRLGTQNDNIQDMISKKRFVKHSGEKASRFSKEMLKEIRSKYTGKRGEKLKLSKEYNCSPTTITNVLNDWK